MGKIPRKLGTEPIVEVVTELRFQPGDPGKVSILPGLVFSQFGSTFPQVEMIQLPPIEHESLATTPTHRFQGSGGVISISRRAVAFGVVRPYPGWGDFRTRAHGLFDFVARSKTFGDIDRVSIKYVNLLTASPTDDQLALTNATINMGGRILKNENFALRAEFPKDKLLTGIIQIISRATTTPTAEVPEQLEGIVLDIDVIAAGPFTNGIEGAMEALDAAHAYEKELFFSLLNPAELEKYAPEY